MPENNNLAYTPTEWIDHIVDPTLPETDPNRVVQQGTRFTAGRANNIENGISGLYSLMGYMSDEIARMKAEIEMLGRAPVNNGSFLDVLDGTEPRNITPLNESAVLQAGVSVGATKLTLDKAVFPTGVYVTLYDDMHSEDVKVVSYAGNVATVTATIHAYKKGSGVSRSTSVVKDGKLIMGTWNTYDISATEVV